MSNNIYEVDIRFLKPIIEAYKDGLFDGIGLPIRVTNALESLSQYSYVTRPEASVSLNSRASVPAKKRGKYIKQSGYWSKFDKPTPSNGGEAV